MIALHGSERQPIKNAVITGAAHPAERLEVTLVIRASDPDKLDPTKIISRTEYASRHASETNDVQAVVQFAEKNHLTVVNVDATAHQIILSGTVAQFNAAFSIDLKMYSHKDGTYRGRSGPVHIPDELDGIVQAVLGLDNRLIASPHLRRVRTFGNVRDARVTHFDFTPPTIADLYNFPPGDGHGQTIAIIELGGGYRNADLARYFAMLNLPMPNVVTVSVNHVGNNPTGSADGPDGEVMLDIEVAAAIAPKATIAVYFAPNTDAGFLNAITTAMHDTVNNPSIISISWGGPEDAWSKQAMTVFDRAFQQAAALGISVCAASGDDGSNDGDTDGKAHVDFPASSPSVLGCGGTNIQVANNVITSETVWNALARGGGASGGGVSTFFAVPAYQAQATVNNAALTMRGVPDVAGVADPATGYDVIVDGQRAVFGGTSAVAPLWAGLIARINSNRGKNIGMPHATLYANASAFRDVRFGSNPVFGAAPAWDGVTGLGAPNGQKIAALF